MGHLLQRVGAGLVAAAIGVAAACSATSDGTDESGGVTGTAAATGSGTSTGTATGAGGGLGLDAGTDGSTCPTTCSTDLHAVVDCHGVLVTQCTGTEGCDISTGTCTNACAAAVNNKLSVGCEYYATFMDQLNEQACFAAFVANTWNTPAHITVERDGTPIDLGAFAKIPQGAGPSLSYGTFDAAAGIAPGEVVILFLAGPHGTPGQSQPVCPLPSAVPSGAMLSNQSGIGKSFHIESDVPVVAYEINPYGGGSAAVTGASLLLPTSAWDVNYVAINAYESGPHPTSMNIVAHQDGTEVTMVAVAAVTGGGGLPGSPPNTPFSFLLDAGEHAQFTQNTSLTGSIIQADKPIGFMAGARCSFVPQGVYACDHCEQMIPPVRALGSEYVGVMHRPRGGEPGVWRLLGAVDGTTLTWSTPVGGPATLEQGQLVEFQTGEPFVVQSQDEDHPFLLMAHMSGGSTNGMDGVGDADSVISVPPAQYMSSYVFFADPTYPETNLVVVRSPDEDGQLSDVVLDCAGTLGNWQAVGDYEWTRIDLITGNFEPVGGCTTGRHEISSDGRFGLWVWGWGTPYTTSFTKYVSYGYPGGMNVQPINEVVVPPVPK